MKIALMYTYGIENITIYKVHNKIYVKNNENRYLLCPVLNSKELMELYDIIKKYNLTSEYYEFVMTKNKNIMMTYAGYDYVLLRIRTTPNRIEKRSKNKPILPIKNYLLDRSNWYLLWSKKNDYMEYKISHLKNKEPIIEESFDYYLGLAETAISYLMNANDSAALTKLTITHKRINDTDMENPLNIVFDTEERDIAEYIKYLFLHRQNDTTKVKQILLSKKRTYDEYTKIYARILYPDYYFDLIDDIESGEACAQKLHELVGRITEFEIYLHDIYLIINNSVKIKKIDWL